ncbi:hypothetical protein AKJ09_09389 [Labilithrix luteola]|uniref:Uncharacterized protein n=1 Tax=Labilithrix luteola TaxID=1391654 RepID=A0A0K1QAD1_9BACT|nr:hypothetical protein [Labilithrix luteola]AKV02726.1 hypothetical protein AKJ09_09389 [Labilithrix luteola]
MSVRISEIVSVVPAPALRDGTQGVYLLFVDYEDGRGVSGFGQIYHTDGARQTALEGVLSTNDSLRSMWCSPSGALWTASEAGNVYTTANVEWAKATQTDLDFDSGDADAPWTVTTLPDLRDEGHAPTVGPLWGTSDADVFVGAVGGHVYHWNGKVWRQVYTARREISAFAGTGPNDVYAVGEGATLSHFDGHAWRAIARLKGTRGDDFTGCCTTSDGRLLVCTQQGRLLRRSTKGWKILAANEEYSFEGVALLGDRVFLAANEAGVVEFRDRSFTVARSTFAPSSVMPGEAKLYFLDVASERSYIEYDPSNSEAPYARVRF